MSRDATEASNEHVTRLLPLARGALPWVPGSVGEQSRTPQERRAWAEARLPWLQKLAAGETLPPEERALALEVAAMAWATEAEAARAEVTRTLREQWAWEPVALRWICNTCGRSTPWVDPLWLPEVHHAALDHREAADTKHHEVLLVAQRSRSVADSEWPLARPRSAPRVSAVVPLASGPRGATATLPCPDLRGTPRENTARRLAGCPAGPGVAEGVGFWMENWDEPMPAGSILLTVYTHDDWLVPLMRASGVVTLLGGYLGHAAKTARQMGKPCVTNVTEARAPGAARHDASVLRALHGKRLRVDGDAGTVEVAEP